MKHAIEIGSGAMMYVPSFVKTGSGIQKLFGQDTHTEDGDHISLIRKVGQKLKVACEITLLSVFPHPEQAGIVEPEDSNCWSVA
jgi:hypothetical protein